MNTVWHVCGVEAPFDNVAVWLVYEAFDARSRQSLGIDVTLARYVNGRWKPIPTGDRDTARIRWQKISWAYVWEKPSPPPLEYDGELWRIGTEYNCMMD